MPCSQVSSVLPRILARAYFTTFAVFDVTQVDMKFQNEIGGFRNDTEHRKIRIEGFGQIDVAAVAPRQRPQFGNLFGVSGRCIDNLEPPGLREAV